MRDENDAFSVYVVDDDDAVRDSLVALLEPEGFIVQTFSSADEFLNELEENTPEDGLAACLLLDLNMPGKDGFDLLTILADRDRDLPVVVMTGNIGEKTRTRALQCGAIAFLEKPVDADQLIDTLRNSHAN
jgi:two-component system response regulator FixJ